MADEKPKIWNVVLAEGGFSLSAGPALLLFALIAAYFCGMKRLGGTILKRVFGIVRKSN